MRLLDGLFIPLVEVVPCYCFVTVNSPNNFRGMRNVDAVAHD